VAPEQKLVHFAGKQKLKNFRLLWLHNFLLAAVAF